MSSNIFYVYIRLKDATQTELPIAARQTIRSDCGKTIIMSFSACKEREIEECLLEKVKFWEKCMTYCEAKCHGAELVIHQIQTSNGGIELSHRMMGTIADAKLTLSVTYTAHRLV